MYIVDRIENGFAVCEDDDRVMRNLPLSELPEGTGPGSVIVRINGKYVLDEEEKERRRQRIRELWDSIEDGE